MRRRLAVLTLAAAAAGALAAVPADATCLETFDRGGVRMGTCSAPGGTPSTYICVNDACVWSP